MPKYKEYFGFKSEPFSSSVPAEKLLQLPSMIEVKEKMLYAASLGGVMVVTGDVGSGKSTSLRWAASHFHPSSTQVMNIVATTSSMNDLLKQMCWAADLDVRAASRSFLIKSFKASVKAMVEKKMNVVLVIDEASLLRSDIFAELHVLTQFSYDSQKHLTLVLAGQSTLIDRLTFRMSAPLASRVICKSHLSSITLDQMQEYLAHHLKIAGCKKMIFSDQAVTAIHQGSGGILRKANSLAKGAIVAASIETKQIVEAEQVRVASTELII